MVRSGHPSKSAEGPRSVVFHLPTRNCLQGWQYVQPFALGIHESGIGVELFHALAKLVSARP
jgi:hypothetical protein